MDLSNSSLLISTKCIGMQEFRIENFRKANPKVELPDWQPLGAEERVQIRQKWAVRLGLQTDADPISIVNSMNSVSELISEDPAFDL